MNDFLEILVDNPNEETSFLLRETIDICKRQGIDISSIDVNSSMVQVLNFRNLTKARIYYYSVCNN